MTERNLSAATLQHYYRHLKAFYNFLIEEQFIEKNPLDGVKKPKIPNKLPLVLDVRQISILLNAPDKKDVYRL